MSALPATLPPEVEPLLNGESPDFAVCSRRRASRAVISVLLGFGLFVLAFMSIFVIAFFGPLITKGETTFTANGEEVTATWDNLSPMLLPGLVIGLFVSIGLGMFVGGIVGATGSAGWYIGTPKRLLRYKKNSTVTSNDWSDFTGAIEMSGSNEKADLTLTMNSSRMITLKSGQSSVQNETYTMPGIPNGLQVTDICKERIDGATKKVHVTHNTELPV